MIHDIDRVENIRRRVAVRRETIARMEEVVKDDCFLKRLQLPKNLLGDVETRLSDLLRSSDLLRRDRTLEEEAAVLQDQEVMLGVAEKHSVAFEEAFKKYGSASR
jgi:hypothetical protein